MMVMIKSKIKVINVEYGKGKGELISAQINTRCGESQKIRVFAGSLVITVSAFSTCTVSFYLFYTAFFANYYDSKHTQGFSLVI